MASQIQVLFDNITLHDNTAVINCYLPGKPANDLGANTDIASVCWSRRHLALYFGELYHSNNRSQQTTSSTLYGKMRISSQYDYTTLKSKMLRWLDSNRHYIRKPYIQETRISLLGMLVGSSPTQWRPDLQRELEAAVHTEIGHNIKLDIQNQRTWIVLLPNK